MALISRTMRTRACVPPLSTMRTRACVPPLPTVHCREMNASYDASVEATINPKQMGILIRTPLQKDKLITWARRQNIRRHGTTSNLINESGRNMDFCSKKLRQHEYENFLCTLLLPEEARRGATAVRAFNIEIAQVLYEKRHAASWNTSFLKNAWLLLYTSQRGLTCKVGRYSVRLSFSLLPRSEGQSSKFEGQPGSSQGNPASTESNPARPYGYLSRDRQLSHSIGLLCRGRCLSYEENKQGNSGPCIVVTVLKNSVL